ncbi:shikimate kinase [Salinimicrobium sp. CDJ15-81-2]|nr:shikimate kinase [Salinimicrobium nanhaiense]
MKIILSGYMGSGKTAVGEALAEKLNLAFLDLDEEISREEKLSIPEIFTQKGEIYFRRKESEILQGLLEQEESFILALGGGTPCYGKNLQLLKEAADTTLIYLKTGLFQLKQRLLSEKDKRPLIKDLESPEVLEDFIRKHLFERTFYYNQSDLIIATDDKTIPEIVSEITLELN